MAYLRMLSEQEALNVNTSPSWNELSQVTSIGSSITVNTLLSSDAHTVLLYPSALMYVSFRTANVTTTAGASIAIPTKGTASLTIPRSLGSTIYLCLQLTTGSGETCNVVEA